MSRKIKPDTWPGQIPRRSFLKTSATAMAGLPFVPVAGPFPFQDKHNNALTHSTMDPQKSLIGQYGPWAVSQMPDPPLLSYRREVFDDLDGWRKTAKEKVENCLAAPDIGGLPEVTVHRQYEYDGLEIEEISWQLPFGRPTEAVVLKPKNAEGPLPAVLGLHDHAGNKYLGKRKIIRTQDDLPSFQKELQEWIYEDQPWANELAKRGYVVLVHDVFTFGSRRVYYQDVAGFEWGPLAITDQTDDDPENPENVRAYNEWAAEHEHIMAKSLFSAGLCWPGVFLREDQRALDVLCARPDVDVDRIGCAGLSGGGLRTAYLGGLDTRIKAAVCAGFMTTWADLILNKSFTHTWMAYIPLIPRYLEFAEIYSLRAPLPTMVLNNNHDTLFTLAEMQRADRVLREVFEKAGAGARYDCRFYDGPHKFDRQMQQEAFDWLERWL
ncbi:MAG: hypothetical protein R2824_03795 [Saprospiraceae bacterium]